MHLILILLPILGLISLAKFAISSLYYLYAFFLRPAKDLRSTYGPWAVVTGPTDGIGRSIAFELAAKGLNLVLVARSPSKLASLSASLSHTHPSVATVPVLLDLAADLRPGLARLRAAVAGLDVGVLVNNAGVSHAYSVYFHYDRVDQYAEMVRVNAAALTGVTRVVLEGMLHRKRGAVVNVGSGGAAVIPSYPLFSVYTATKSYVQQLSRSLYVEYKDMGIDVQCLAPGYVDTRQTPDIVRAQSLSLFKPTPDRFARSAVRWIGYDHLCVPYYPHFLQWCMSSRVPDSLNNRLRLAATLQQLKHE